MKCKNLEKLGTLLAPFLLYEIDFIVPFKTKIDRITEKQLQNKHFPDKFLTLLCKNDMLAHDKAREPC